MKKRRNGRVLLAQEHVAAPISCASFLMRIASHTDAQLLDMRNSQSNGLSSRKSEDGRPRLVLWMKNQILSCVNGFSPPS